MKKKLFLINLILLIFFCPLIVFAEQEIGGAGGSTGSGVGSTTNQNYVWPDVTSDNKSLRGVRITLYEFYNNVATAKKSIDVFARQEFSDYLRDNNVNFYTAQTSRLEYGRKAYTDITYGKTTNYKFVTANLPLFGESNTTTLYNFFDPKGANFNQAKVQEYINKFSSLLKNDGAKYYFVIEPTSLLIIGGKRFYGTSYEQAKYIKSKNDEANVIKYLRAHVYHQLPMAYYISNSTITSPDRYNFNGFLSSVGAVKVSDSDITTCKATNASDKCMTNQDILDYTYGIGILSYEAFVKTEQENCAYTVNVNRCADIGVSEPSSAVCTVGKPSNFYEGYTDGGRIYCSDSLSTNLTDFYSSLDSVKRAGSYFPMNDLKITNVMSCYIARTNTSADLSNWQSIINSKNGGDIYLTIGGRKYTLTSTKTNNSPTCVSWSGGICEKATLSTEYSYSLNPLVNRYINIETMKEDTNQFPTNNNIDNGGPRLTVPINYQPGTYKYELNFNNSIFSGLKSEVSNSNSKIRRNGINYEITYTTSKSLTDSDLIFNCPFDVKQDLTDIDTPKCTNLPEDKCCDEDGKIVECPKECTGECCDENGNEIMCPGDESKIKDIIYRPISLVNPFPGILGNDRTPGKNWDKIVTIGGRTHSASDYYIRYNRGYDDYDLYRDAEPLYVIKLDGNKIKAIREYNDYKNHDYNNFKEDFICVVGTGEKCISKFLRGRADGFNINLIDSGTCKNITHSTFNSCITRK